jgi:hypothetical protein
MNQTVLRLPERPGVGRLGRHVEHDERSRAYGVVLAPAPLVSVDWKRHCDPYNQGDVGSCTGNAIAGLCMTGPFFRPGVTLTETEALYLYEAATHLDKIPGSFPPNDTGSSGLAAAKAAKRAGLIAGYAHAFGLSQALHALSRAPVITGIDWFNGFDTPVGDAAELRIDGESRGGHEVVLDGIDVKAGFVKGTNSWGLGWGNRGRFVMSFKTFGALLKMRGDVVAPVPLPPVVVEQLDLTL